MCQLISPQKFACYASFKQFFIFAGLSAVDHENSLGKLALYRRRSANTSLVDDWLKKVFLKTCNIILKSPKG